MDLKRSLVLHGNGLPRALVDVDCRRSLREKAGSKRVEFGGVTFDFDDRALGRIGDPAAQVMAVRKPIDERAKSHSLHAAPNNKSNAARR